MPRRGSVRQRDRRGASLSSGSHRLHHRRRAEDRHDAPEVVCEDMKAHLGADVLACFHKEVRGAHPEFQRAKRVLDGLTTYAHYFRLMVEPLLHRFDGGLMFPALYPASLLA